MVVLFKYLNFLGVIFSDTLVHELVQFGQLVYKGRAVPLRFFPFIFNFRKTYAVLAVRSSFLYVVV